MTSLLLCGIRRRVLAGALWLFAVAGVAQETNTAWLVRSWQSDDGLPENTVLSLAQTPDNYLWIGTPMGLARFDGLRFENFSLTNVVVHPNLGVITLLHARDGTFWLGMDRGGVVHLNGKASRAFTQGLPQQIPNGLVEDAQGGLWITYRNGSVYRINHGEVSQFTAQQGLPEGSDICALATDREGRLWFAKAGQVGQFREGVFQTLHHLDSQPMRLAGARASGVWLCSGFRLYRCDPADGLKDLGVFQPATSGTMATVLLEDHKGAVWLGTLFSGLYRYDQTGFTTVPTTHKGILSLLEDNEGNIWAGTSGGGLDRIRPRSITLQGAESGLPFPSVRSICEDAEGSIWAVTQNRDLVHYANGRWSVMPVSGDWPGDAACVTADGQGSVWIGSTHGLYCWRGGRFVNWGAPAATEDKKFNTVLVSRAGALWLGQETPSAILRLRDGQLTTFALPPDSRVVRAMAEDAEGNIWAGTSKGTLFRVTRDQLAEMTPQPLQEIAPIRCLYASPDGFVWIGYAGRGAGCLKNGRYTEFKTEKGLYDNFISQIVADGHGWLWFGANHGIFRVPEQDFKEVIAGQASRVRSVHYGRGEGLPNLQAPFGESPNVLCARDGRLWFPMQTALVVVDPARLKPKSEPPPTFLSQVTVDGRMAAQYRGILPGAQDMGSGVLDLAAAGTELRLPPSHRRLEIAFAAPSFHAPENIQFRYRLRGIDVDWMESGTDRSATYSRLPAGNYVFEMTGCNGDSGWNKTSATLSLVVAPSYWQTWWFRLGALAAFTAGVITTVRYISFRRLRQRMRMFEQQAALQKERARIAKDIHDDLGASLTQVAYLGELAHLNRDEPDKVDERIRKMSATARQAVKSLDEIVWAVNPRNDTLAHLIDYTNQFAFGYLRVVNIRVRLDFPDHIPQRELSADLRHNIFLTVKEALHNIVKHAAATEVRLGASVTQQALEIVVEDNGCGFSIAPDDALADGLRNMRQRMADIGGECRVESRPGSGTKVILNLRWPELNKK
ncbi:MAG: two-component regulator propeller domain-containing protein [Verrucomicrobiota bacterium]